MTAERKVLQPSPSPQACSKIIPEGRHSFLTSLCSVLASEISPSRKEFTSLTQHTRTSTQEEESQGLDQRPEPGRMQSGQVIALSSGKPLDLSIPLFQPVSQDQQVLYLNSNLPVPFTHIASTCSLDISPSQHHVYVQYRPGVKQFAISTWVCGI